MSQIKLDELGTPSQIWKTLVYLLKQSLMAKYSQSPVLHWSSLSMNLAHIGKSSLQIIVACYTLKKIRFSLRATKSIQAKKYKDEK